MTPLTTVVTIDCLDTFIKRDGIATILDHIDIGLVVLILVIYLLES